MREGFFIKHNQETWKEFEQIVRTNGKADNPDRLAELFIRVTDDLSYARTQYPNSNTVSYLNGLAARMYLLIYQNRKEKRSRYRTFWTTELPLTVAESHRQLLYAFLLFVGSVLVGWFSTAYDENFPRLILGDDYVNMTIANIKNNDPMAVYKNMRSDDMFFLISLNNIRVSFFAFALGLLTAAGSGFVLMQNGIMVGAFQFFFHRYDLLLDSALTIWIHGTLEISVIIIAGGAGMVMGNSWLFPGSFPRLYSLRRGGEKGLKIVIGLVPIFVVAALLEGFVTRLTDMHISIKLFIIGGSLGFILWYFVYYPLKIKKLVADRLRGAS